MPERPLSPRRVLALAVALLALPLAAAAHRARPAAYGDTVTVRFTAPGPAAVRLLTEAGTAGTETEPEAEPSPAEAVEAYVPATGSRRWTYARDGRRPLVVRAVTGHVLVLWDDGLVTDSSPRGGSVRWHRAVPGAADWLGRPEARGGAGMLQPLDRGRMLAVVTPRRIAGYRVMDGDLRWVLPARPGCAYHPPLAVRRGPATVIAQPCADSRTAWTGELVAVDGLGRIVPRRRPPGKGVAGRR